MKTLLDKEIYKLIDEYGYKEVIGGLVRFAQERKLAALFNKLDKIYKWLCK